MKHCKRFFPILVLSLFLSTSAKSSNPDTDDTSLPPLQNSFRLNLLSPGLEWQFVTSERSILTLNPSLIYTGNTPILSHIATPSTAKYQIDPRFIIQHLWFYNRERRFNNGRITEGNSGDYVSLRFFAVGPSLISNYSEKNVFTFAIGPTWGIQRKWGKSVSFQFELGPVVYIDIAGDKGFAPYYLKLTIGLILK